MNRGTFHLDTYQKKAVFYDGGAVVSAGAGSGKTRVLAERFVRLVEEKKARIDAILTLTFTRKAAAEMYERIYQYLSQNAEDHVKQQAASFEKAQISTLDSFCAKIVRNRAEQLGLPPDFTTDEEQLFRNAEEISLAFLLEKRDSPAVRAISAFSSFPALWENIFIPFTREFAVFGKEVSLRSMIEEELAEKKVILPGILEKLEGTLEKIRVLGSESEDPPKTLASAVCTAKETPDLAEYYVEYGPEELYSLLGRLSMPKGSDSWKNPCLRELKIILDEYHPIHTPAIEIAGFLAEEKLFIELYGLWDELKNRFLSIKRKTGILSFQDVINCAIEILKKDDSLRNYYSHRFSHIMIDEFQDNNQQQKELLLLLAGNKIEKLFFLGDEKQSIYRFRGADVTVFKTLDQEITKLGGKSLTLKRNYRSHPGLITFFNSLFAKILTGEEPFDARFENLESREEETRDLSLSPSIGLFVKPKTDVSPDEYVHHDDAEAHYIGEHIKRMVEEKQLLLSENGEIRAAEYHDIALLLRTTGNQIRYEKVFRKMDIPYDTQDVRSLFIEAPINDLYSILQFTLYPEDRQSFASALRSPFAYLSDDSVAEILLASPAEDPPVLPEEEKRKYYSFLRTVEEIREKIDILPTADILRFLWYEKGYRYSLLRSVMNQAYIEYFDYFTALAETFDRRGEPCALFLDYVRDHLDAHAKLPELPVIKGRTGGVQILTIHKSKGLEFPVVYVANMGNSGRAPGGEKLYTRKNGTILCSSLGRSKEYVNTIIREENSAEEAAENKRLLYVGLTRAENHLFLSGYLGSPGNSLLSLLTDALELREDAVESTFSSMIDVSLIPDVPLREYRNSVKKDPPGKKGKSDRATAEYLLSGDTISLESPPQVLGVTEFITSLEDMEGKDISYPREEKKGEENNLIDILLREEGLETDFGTLCHYVAEKKITGDYLRKGIPRQMLLPFNKNREEIISLAETYGDSIFSSPLGGKISNAEKTEQELPFLLGVERDLPLLRGRMDLVLFFHDKLEVVDFKTDSRVEPLSHSLQMYLYRTALEKIYHREVKSYLFYLRFGKLVEEKGVPKKSLTVLLKDYTFYCSSGFSSGGSNS